MTENADVNPTDNSPNDSTGGSSSGPAMCSYDGENYPPGAEACDINVREMMVCQANGTWKYTGEPCEEATAPKSS